MWHTSECFVNCECRLKGGGQWGFREWALTSFLAQSWQQTLQCHTDPQQQLSCLNFMSPDWITPDTYAASFLMSTSSNFFSCATHSLWELIYSWLHLEVYQVRGLDSLVPVVLLALALQDSFTSNCLPAHFGDSRWGGDMWPVTVLTSLTFSDFEASGKWEHLLPPHPPTNTHTHTHSRTHAHTHAHMLTHAGMHTRSHTHLGFVCLLLYSHKHQVNIYTQVSL